MPFDPDAFLAAPHPKAAAADFDPDAFLGKKKSRSWKEVLADAPKAAFGELGDAYHLAKNAAGSLLSGPDEARTAQDAAAGKFMPLEVARGLLAHPDPKQVQADAQAGNFSPAGGHFTPYTAALQGDTDPLKEAVATRPLSLVGDIAGAAGLMGRGRAALGAVSDLATSPVRRLGHAIADLPPARRAENQLLEAAHVEGGNPQAMAAQLETNRAPVPDVNFSAAQATQRPAVTALERRSRNAVATAPGWANFDATQNTAMFNALHGVAAPATEEALAAAKAVRDHATRYERGAAEALADQGSLEAGAGREGMNLHADPIREAMAQELAGRRGAVPGAQRLSDYVNQNVARGSEPAGSTYEVRKVLTDALNSRAGIDTGDLKSAVKSSDVTARHIVGAIDGSLDRASGGIWRQYLDAFQANSGPVNNTRALSDIREELEAKIRGGTTDANGNPKLSRAFINQVIERHATNDFGDVLSPDAQRRLNDIRTTAQQLEAPNQNYRAATTGGGGADTSHNFALSGARHLAHALGPVGRLATSVASGIASPIESASALRLADLLRQPGEAATALRAAAAREAARAGRRSTGTKASALAAILAAQRQPQQ